MSLILTAISCPRRPTQLALLALSCRGVCNWFLVLVLVLPWNPQSISGQQPLHAARARNAGGPTSIIVRDCRLRLVDDLKLSCERSGILDYVVSRGTLVKKGDVIARLKDSIAQANFAIAQRESDNDVEVRFARKAAELAQLKYERAKQAEQTISGTVTDFELRELRLAAERSLLQLQQAEHQFKIAELRKNQQKETLRSYQLTAPFDALVRVAHKKTGEFVGEGDIVLELVNDNNIRVDGLVDLEQLPMISTGSRVIVLLEQASGEPIQFPGQVTFVDTKIEPVSMRASISAEVQNNRSLLKDGLLVTMAVATDNGIAVAESTRSEK